MDERTRSVRGVEQRESLGELSATSAGRNSTLIPTRKECDGAGTALATGKGAWDAVWRRFCEAPQLYPGIGKLLSEPAAPGQGLLSFDISRNPRANEEEERDVRTQLEAIGAMAPAEAAADAF